MIHLKSIILNALADLKVNNWDEALLMEVLAIARHFFSGLPLFGNTNRKNYPDAMEKTKQFVDENKIEVPFKLDAPDVQDTLRRIGFHIKNVKDFAWLYSWVINPFAVYPHQESGSDMVSNLLKAAKIARNSQAIFSNRKPPYPSDDRSDGEATELDKLAKKIDRVQIGADTKNTPNEATKKIYQYCRKYAVRLETALHLYRLIFCDGITDWDTAAAMDRIIQKLPEESKEKCRMVFQTMLGKKEIQPVALIKMIVCPKKRDESGLETTYIATQIYKYASGREAVLVDPSPDFVQKCINVRYKSRVALANEDQKAIYQKEYWDNEKVSFCGPADLQLLKDSCCLTWFSTGKEWDEEKQKMDMLDHVPVNSLMMMVVPDTLFNARKAELKEQWSRQQLQLSGILLLPAFRNGTNQPPNKCLLLLEKSGRPTENHNVEIRRMVYDPSRSQSAGGDRIALMDHRMVFICYDDLIAEKRNVRALYREQLQEETRKVKYAERHFEETVFIEEIKDRLHCSLIKGKRARNNPCPVKVTYNPSGDMEAVTREVRPDLEDTEHYKKEMKNARDEAARQELMANLRRKVNTKIEAMLYEEPFKSAIQEDIRYAINQKTQKEREIAKDELFSNEEETKTVVPTLKALAFYFQDDLKETYPHAFDPVLCRQVFDVNHKALIRLVPDEKATEAAYREAVMESFPDRIKKCPVCNAVCSAKESTCNTCGNTLKGVKAEKNDKRYRQIFKQMKMILRMAAENQIPVSIAHVRSLEEEYASSERLTPEQQQARNALAMKAYTDEQEKKIAEYLFVKKGSAALSANELAKRIYCILRYFYPCTAKEIRALTWGDYERTGADKLHALVIYKERDEKDKIVLYADTGRSLKFRMLPIAPLLTELIGVYRKALKGMDPEACEPGKPLIQMTDEDNHVLHLISSKQASSLEVLLDKISGRKEMNQEKTLPGLNGGRKTNLSQTRRELLKSNWIYRVKEVGMTNGESSYLRGVSADTTYDNHYCDYSNQFVQLMMALKINRWINQLLIEHTGKETIMDGQHQQVSFYRFTKPDKEITMKFRGNRYGIKATITYTAV